MNSFDARYRFQFNYDRFVDEQVEGVCGLHVDAVIHKRELLLSFYGDPSLNQFVAETRLMAGFEKSGSQLPMNAYGGAYERARSVVDPRSEPSTSSVVDNPFETCLTANLKGMPEHATRIPLGDL